MSDYGKLLETEILYLKAVDYGMIPPNWDGTPPGTLASQGTVSAERHGDHAERREGKRS